MQGTIPITPEGLQRLKAELQNLRSVERPKIIAEVAAAREHGDLKENAEYHAAREKHGFIEGRIAELESTLSRVEVIDPATLSGNRVAFGATVRLSNVDLGDEVTYRIVGPAESDFEKGSISVTSPLARQLIGREVGDEVKVKTPGGMRTYEVLDIAFG
ncbi:MAG: transcription elongation factor GreA [Polyangiales bacterium]